MAKNSSIVLDIGAEVGKSWKSALSGIGKDLTTLNSQIQKNVQEYNQGANAVDKYTKKTTELQNVIDNGNSTTQRFAEKIRNISVQNKNLEVSSDNAVKKINALNEELKRLHSMQRSTSAKTFGAVLSDSTKRSLLKRAKIEDFTETKQGKIRTAQADIISAKSGLKRAVTDQKQYDKDSDEYKKRQKNVDAYTASLDKANQALAKLWTLENLDKNSTIYAEAKVKAQEVIKASIEKTTSALDREYARLNANSQKYVHNQNEIAITEQRSAEYTSSLGNQLNTYSERLNDANEQTENATKNIGQNFRTFLGNVAVKSLTAVMTSLVNIGKTAVQSLGRLTGIFSKTVASAIGLEKAIRLIVQYGFGFRSLYYLIRRFRTGIQQGFEYLGGATKSAKKVIAGMSEEVHKLLETIKELGYFLKSAAAAMLQPFMPLINDIIPRLVSWFNTLATAVANFIATLTGQAYIYKASTNLEDYANALDQVGGSAKEAKKQLAAFDDINVLDKQKAGSGGGGSTLDTSNWFTQESTDPSELANLIKKAWEEANFEPVGAYIAKKFASILDAVRWDEIIFPYIRKIALSIATFINGMTSVLDLSKEIGEFVANIFNGITEFVYTYVNTLKWDQLGQFIVDAINNFLSTFDAGKFGESLHDFADGLMTMLGEIFSGLDSSQVASGIAEFFQGLDIPDLAKKLMSVAKQFAFAFADAIQNWAKTDPDSFGLATAFATALAGLKITGMLTPLISSLLTAPDTSLLAKGFENMFSGIDLTKIGDMFSNLFKTLSNNPIFGIVAAIGLLVAAFIRAYNTSEEFRESVNNLWNNNLKPFLDTLGTTIGELWSKHLSPLWNNIQQLLGSVLDLLQPILNLLVTYLIPAFTSITSAVIDAAGALLSNFTDAINGVVEVFNGLLDFIVGIFTQDWDRAWEGIKKIFRGVWQGICGIFGAAWNAMIAIVNGIISLFENVLNAIIRKINEFRIDVPNWPMLFGDLAGKSFGFNIPEASFKKFDYVDVKIPELAQGAVIPPNKEFLALLGDQNSGTNIETPLDTMIQAFETALANSTYANNQPIVLQIDGKTLARLTVPNTLSELDRMGYNVKVLEK